MALAQRYKCGLMLVLLTSVLMTSYVSLRIQLLPVNSEADLINASSASLEEYPSSSMKENNDRVPAFIISGAQKAGTTALYHILSAIPGLQPSIGLETHFFDSIRGSSVRNHTYETLTSKESIDLARLEYRGHFNTTMDPKVLFFEKTPSYICTPEAPGLIKRVVPWAKVIIMLRNPVDRAFSHYKMILERTFYFHRIYKKFDREVDKEITALRERNLTHAPTLIAYLQGGTSPNAFREKLVSPEITTSELRINRKTMKGYLARGLYVYQLMNWMEHFTIGKDLLVLPYESFRKHPEDALQQILNFVGAQDLPWNASILGEEYKPKTSFPASETLRPVTEEYLVEFFSPYNQLLTNLLGEDWPSAW